jgi:hypothetical protein
MITVARPFAVLDDLITTPALSTIFGGAADRRIGPTPSLGHLISPGTSGRLPPIPAADCCPRGMVVAEHVSSSDRFASVFRGPHRISGSAVRKLQKR